MGGTGSCGCREHQGTSENAQEEILHNPDWFSEGKVDESTGSAQDMCLPDDLSLPEASDDALPATESADPHKNRNAFIQAKLSNSSCTKHISPYQDDLINFTDIPPKSFRVENKQSFSATGTGNLIVDLPNGKEKSKLELTNIQYSPEVTYTLVSVVYLNDQGFTVKFGGGKCEITDPNGIKVGAVPKTDRGLH